MLKYVLKHKITMLRWKFRCKDTTNLPNISQIYYKRANLTKNSHEGKLKSANQFPHMAQHRFSSSKSIKKRVETYCHRNKIGALWRRLQLLKLVNDFQHYSLVKGGGVPASSSSSPSLVLFSIPFFTSFSSSARLLISMISSVRDFHWRGPMIFSTSSW